MSRGFLRHHCHTHHGTPVVGLSTAPARRVRNSSWGKGWNQEDTLQKLTQQVRNLLFEREAPEAHVERV